MSAAELQAIHVDVMQLFTHRQFSHVSPRSLIRNHANDFLSPADLV